MVKFLLGVIFAVLVIAAVLVAVVLLVPQSAAPGTAAAPTARAVPGTPAPVVQTQIDAVAKALADAKQSGKAVPVTLTFKEADLTASARGYFPQALANLTFTDPVVTLPPGQLVLTASATTVLGRTQAVVTASPLVTSGKADVKIDSATIAGIALPDATVSGLSSQLRAVVNAGLDPKFVVESVSIVNATLSVKGTANP